MTPRGLIQYYFAQVGPTIASINLILVSDVSFVERRGYLTISIEAGGVGRNCFRRSSSVRSMSSR